MPPAAPTVPFQTWMMPTRPTRGWLGLICRLLPPQGPQEMVDLQAHRDVFRPVTDRVIAAGSLAAVVAMGFLGSRVLPFLGTSPATHAVRASADDAGNPTVLTAALALTLTGVLVGLSLLTLVAAATGRLHETLYQWALREELWFRAGSQAWTWPQRARACALFGVAHLLNLIVAFVTLGALAGTGAVFMAVYLHQLRASGDQDRAVVHAALVHARYNVYALLLMSVAVLGSLARTFLMA